MFITLNTQPFIKVYLSVKQETKDQEKKEERRMRKEEDEG